MQLADIVHIVNQLIDPHIVIVPYELMEYAQRYLMK